MYHLKTSRATSLRRFYHDLFYALFDLAHIVEPRYCRRTVFGENFNFISPRFNFNKFKATNGNLGHFAIVWPLSQSLGSLTRTLIRFTYKHHWYLSHATTSHKSLLNRLDPHHHTGTCERYRGKLIMLATATVPLRKYTSIFAHKWTAEN